MIPAPKGKRSSGQCLSIQTVQNPTPLTTIFL